VRFRLAEGTAPPAGAKEAGDGAWELVPQDVTRELHELTGWAIDHDVELHALEIVRPSLEDVYLQLTGEPGAHGAPAAELVGAGGGRRRRRVR
jgi:ABC-2 type transport system ATP-binding protein